MVAPPSDAIPRLLAGGHAVTWVPVPGAPGVRIGVRVLPPATLERLRFLEPNDRAFVRGALVASLVAEDGTQLFDRRTIDDLDEAAVTELFGHLRRVSDGPPAAETVAALESWVKASPLERARARYAEGIVAYYGLSSARSATPWQVIAYTQLRGHDDDDGEGHP